MQHGVLANKAADTLDRLMAMARLNDREVAERLDRAGYSRSSIHNMRTGAKPMALRDIETFAEFFDLPTTAFLIDEWPSVLRRIADNQPWWIGSDSDARSRCFAEMAWSSGQPARMLLAAAGA